jgi:hypothetical protein
MTLEPHDGLAVAITPGRRALAARFPAGRFGTARVRYCPLCLREDQGRGPVTWRLPWSFACPRHRVLLLDFCPACHRPPRPWNARRLGPQAGGACTRDNPATAARRGGCGTDLTGAEAVSLPAGGLVLAAHQHPAALMASPPGSRAAALTALRQVYATAWRALWGLHAIPGQAPPAVHAVLDEIGAVLPGRDGAEPGDDARTAAIGAALACIALDETCPEHEALFGWILQADRSLLKDRRYTPGIGAVAKRWAWCGPALPAGAVTRRAAMIPAMLWPGWALRLLPQSAGLPAGVAQRTAYRRPPPESGITREWLHHEYVVKLRSIDSLARERGVTAPYLKSLARNWGLPIRRHSDFSGIGHLNLPAPPSPAMRAVTMRTGALSRLELITRIPGHDSIAAAARFLYDGRDGALRQMIAKIETAAGFPIIDRSGTPLSTTDVGRAFICEAHQILQAAREQTKPHPDPEGRREVPPGHAENPSAADSTPTAN